MMHRWIHSLKADHISFFFQVSFSRNTLLATCLMSLTSYCSLLIKCGRYNPASRCSPSLLCCAWTKYRNRCAHKYHSTSTYSVIFMLQRSSLCICLNSRFFQYLVSHYVSFYLLPYHISSSGTEEARNSSVISHHSGSLVEHCVKMGAEMTKFKKARR